MALISVQSIRFAVQNWLLNAAAQEHLQPKKWPDAHLVDFQGPVEIHKALVQPLKERDILYDEKSHFHGAGEALFGLEIRVEVGIRVDQNG